VRVSGLWLFLFISADTCWPEKNGLKNSNPAWRQTARAGYLAEKAEHNTTQTTDNITYNEIIETGGW
jgi:hypothetical protein